MLVARNYNAKIMLNPFKYFYECNIENIFLPFKTHIILNNLHYADIYDFFGISVELKLIIKILFPPIPLYEHYLRDHSDAITHCVSILLNKIVFYSIL